jgi:hypothetical protein
MLSSTEICYTFTPTYSIHLIKQDLDQIKIDKQKFLNYFKGKNELFQSIFKKQPKEIIQLTIDYLNQLEKHQRLLPEFIYSNQKYFFQKVPLEMIQLIQIVSSNQPGLHFSLFKHLFIYLFRKHQIFDNLVFYRFRIQ